MMCFISRNVGLPTSKFQRTRMGAVVPGFPADAHEHMNDEEARLQPPALYTDAR